MATWQQHAGAAATPAAGTPLRRHRGPPAERSQWYHSQTTTKGTKKENKDNSEKTDRLTRQTAKREREDVLWGERCKPLTKKWEALFLLKPKLKRYHSKQQT